MPTAPRAQHVVLCVALRAGETKRSRTKRNGWMICMRCCPDQDQGCWRLGPGGNHGLPSRQIKWVTWAVTMRSPVTVVCVMEHHLSKAPQRRAIRFPRNSSCLCLRSFPVILFTSLPVISLSSSSYFPAHLPSFSYSSSHLRLCLS